MAAAAKTPLAWIVAALICSIAFGAANWWPASWWLEYRSLSVSNAVVGEPIRMTADRTIARPFVATWNVTLRVWNGGWEVYPCGTTRTQNYTPDTKLPHDLTLAWWTGKECATLPAGRYKMTTTWRINLQSPLPDKRVTIESNVFEVTP